MGIPFLSILLITPLIVIFVLALVKTSPKSATFATLAGCIIYGLQVVNLLNFSANSSGDLVLVEKFNWMSLFGVNMIFGLDNLGAYFLLLTAAVFIISCVSSFRELDDKSSFRNILYMLTLFGVTGLFLAQDIIQFYVFWEVAVLPPFFVIRYCGTGNREKVSVTYILYSLFGSIFMLAGFVYYFNALNVNFPDSSYAIIDWIETAGGITNGMSAAGIDFIFFAILIAFAIKTPLVPFHSWQPMSYKSAPLSQTIILSGLLSKLGIFGILKIVYPVFGELISYYSTQLMAVGLIGLIYGAMIAMVTKDIRELIAFSSISHLGLIVLGIFSVNPDAMQGALLQTLNHAVVAAALFFGLSSITFKLGTGDHREIRGLWKLYPAFSSLYFIVVLSNLVFPGLSTFVGEIKILIGAFAVNQTFAVIAILGTIFSSVYMLTLFRNIFFGEVPAYVNALPTPKADKLILGLVVIFLVVVGVYPQILSPILSSIVNFDLSSIGSMDTVNSIIL